MEEPFLGEAGARAAAAGSWRPIFVQAIENLLGEGISTQRPARRGCCPPLSCRGESVQRCLGNTRFCLVLSTTAVATASPWVLSLAEALAMLLIYFLAVPDALLVRCHLKDFHYVFGRSTEDLLALALVRGFTIVAAHWAIPGLVYRRPYLLYAIAFAAIEIPFVAYKLVAMRHLHASHASRAPFLAMCVLQLVAAAAHVAAAEGAVSWARRRARMGLLNPTRTLSNSLEEGTMGGVAAMHADNAGEDVAPAVPDEGSQFFADVYTPNREEPDMHAVIQVHYKVALPCTTLPGSMPADGIVLIHSFGGGVHSWRHVLQPLADATSAAVVAFDRPGFGLTSRPPPAAPNTPPQLNPYSMQYQADLAIRLAASLELQRIILAGTGDGAHVALLAAAAAHRRAQDALQLDHATPQQSGSMGPTSPDRQRPSSSLSASHDLSWMGSAVPIGRRKEVLDQLLRGQLPPASPSPFHANASSHTPPVLGISPNRSTGQQHSVGTAVQQGDHRRSDSLWGIDEARPQSLSEAGEGFDPGNGDGGDGDGRSPSRPGSRLITPQYGGATPPGPLTVAGIALLHPDLSGHSGPLHVRVLSKSRVGRRALQRLLSTEVGDVGNSKAWADGAVPSPEVLALYQRYLRAPAWDAALVEVCHAASAKLSRRRLEALVAEAVGARGETPLLVVHGAQDRLCALHEVQMLSARVPRGQLEVMQRCGHLSHEEDAQGLVACLGRFVRDVLAA